MTSFLANVALPLIFEGVLVGIARSVDEVAYPYSFPFALTVPSLILAMISFAAVVVTAAVVFRKWPSARMVIWYPLGAFVFTVTVILVDLTSVAFRSAKLREFVE